MVEIGNNIHFLKVRVMKKDLTDKEKEERMNYLTIHKCKNEDERKELKELCDWYFKDTPTLTMSFSLTEEDLSGNNGRGRGVVGGSRSCEASTP